MNENDIFAASFENLRTGVLLLEKSTGCVTEANPAFLRMCACPRSGVVGRNFWAPPLIDDASAGAEVFEHLRSGGRVEGVEMAINTGDGSRRLLQVSGGELSAGVVQLEVRDATAAAVARMAERRDAQRSLAVRVAVEFSEMDRELRAAAEMPANCARRGQSTFPEPDKIRKAADRAGELARELSAFSGQLTLDTRPVQLNKLLEAMQPALERMLGLPIQLVRDLDPNVAPVMADPAQVRQIVMELASNSREAMEHGGRFRIATRNAPANDPALRRNGDASYAVLEVGDEGPGLDDQSWEHLYEPFFTTKPNGRRGLGLAAVHGIVHQMRGRLWAQSDPVTGTSFRIYLPLAQAESVAAPDGRADRGSPAAILLIERDEGLRTVMTNILQKRGYRVLGACGAEDALELAKTGGPLDLIICEPELQTQFRTYARVAALSKPFELETLLGKVRESLPA
ncbi:MAG TPA: ATP-binding protein [Bryobacteraceae bacterium]|nr:ATP-binding protein [Bryobacteraceae bacterium]